MDGGCDAGDLVTYGTAVEWVTRGRFNTASVPSPAAFTVTIDGTPHTAGAIHLEPRFVFLVIGTPVPPSAQVTLSYDPAAAVDPLRLSTDDAVNVVVSSFRAPVLNLTGRGYAQLHGFDDWANLLYDFSHTPDAADGVNRLTPLDEPELTSEDVLATAADLDGDEDGASNATDNCIDVANFDQADSDGDGIGDACDAGAADDTPPQIAFALSSAANGAGWHKADVTAMWTVADDESGVAESSGCDAVTVATDTAGLILTCAATNGAGLSASESVTIRLDKTPPAIGRSPRVRRRADGASAGP